MLKQLKHFVDAGILSFTDDHVTLIRIGQVCSFKLDVSEIYTDTVVLSLIQHMTSQMKKSVAFDIFVYRNANPVQS